VTVRISYTRSFGPAFGKVITRSGEATWTVPQGCAERFQHPGYNCDNPGSNTFTLKLVVQSFCFEQGTRWTSPCNGHSIGTETVRKDCNE
jgi:hypothetical protein